MTSYQAVFPDQAYINQAFTNAVKEIYPVSSNPRANGPAGKLFRLVRAKDTTNTSGTGHIASGVEWPDGSVTLKWHVTSPNVANVGHYANKANMLSIHGAQSKEWPYQFTTRVVYVVEEKPAAAGLLKELSNFSYELGDVAEQIGKGLAPDVQYIKSAYGRILDLAQAAA